MLYVLCVLYCRHYVVYTKWQPWHTINPDSGLTFNMVEEMCETKLLYIVENLFGVLCRLPLNRPITPPIVLSDIQASRLLTRDPSHNIHLTIIGVTRQQHHNLSIHMATDADSSLEPTMVNQQPSTGPTVDTSIEDNKLVKTESTTDKLVPLDIFGDAYAALIATPKIELEEDTSSNAATNTQQIKISDVHTIGIIVKDEPMDSTQIITIDLHCKLHGCSTSNTNADTLQEVTTWNPIRLVGNCNMLPVLCEFPLSEATSTHMESLQEPTLSSANTYVNMEEPSYITSQLPESTLPEATPLHEGTSIISPVSDVNFPEATDKDTSKTSLLMNTSTPTASVPSSTITCSSTLLDQDDYVLSNSANIIPTENDTPKNVAIRTSPCLNNKGSEQELTVIRQPIDLCAGAPPIKTDMYYSLLNVEQDDIIYLHHKDILKRTQCSVKVDKLSQTDVRLARAALCDPVPSLEMQSGESTIKNKDIDIDLPVKKPKKKSK